MRARRRQSREQRQLAPARFPLRVDRSLPYLVPQSELQPHSDLDTPVSTRLAPSTKPPAASPAEDDSPSATSFLHRNRGHAQGGHEGVRGRIYRQACCRRDCSEPSARSAARYPSTTRDRPWSTSLAQANPQLSPTSSPTVALTPARPIYPTECLLLPLLVSAVASAVAVVVTVVAPAAAPVAVRARTRRRSGASLRCCAPCLPFERILTLNARAQGSRHQAWASREGRQDQVDRGDLPLLAPGQGVPDHRHPPPQAQGCVLFLTLVRRSGAAELTSTAHPSLSVSCRRGHEDHARPEADPCRSAHPLQGVRRHR